MTIDEFRLKFAVLIGEAFEEKLITGFVFLWKNGRSGGFMADTTNTLEVAKRLRGTASSIEAEGNIVSEGAYVLDLGSGLEPVKINIGEEGN